LRMPQYKVGLTEESYIYVEAKNAELAIGKAKYALVSLFGRDRFVHDTYTIHAPIQIHEEDEE